MNAIMNKSELEFLDRVRKHWFLRFSVLSSDVADFIACQFALESNFGTSRLATIQYNYCGMKVPSKRAFFGYSLNGDVFASYSTFDYCIIDYVSWLFYNRPTTKDLRDVNSFKSFLVSSRYCTEDSYVGRINVLYNNFKNHSL